MSGVLLLYIPNAVVYGSKGQQCASGNGGQLMEEINSIFLPQKVNVQTKTYRDQKLMTQSDV